MSAKAKRVIRGRPVDEQFIAEVVALRKQGKKQEAIAVELGVAQGTISSILRKCGLGVRTGGRGKRR